MIQRPNAVGLVLCEDVLIEQGTGSVTLLRCFDRLVAKTFPTPPKRFTACTVLTDGLGQVNLYLSVRRLETEEEIYARDLQVTFRDPLAQVRVAFRIGSCAFPSAGRYEFLLSVENESIAQCVLTVIKAK